MHKTAQVQTPLIHHWSTLNSIIHGHALPVNLLPELMIFSLPAKFVSKLDFLIIFFITDQSFMVSERDFGVLNLKNQYCYGFV